MVLLSEEGASGGRKKLSEFMDLPHNVNSTQSSLEEEKSESSGQLYHHYTEQMDGG